MDRYSINTVEQLTGVKAHTLRIWEKRYQSLVPHRTETNIRYYDDAQLKRLLNISTLIAYGYKISALSSYSNEKIAELMNGLIEPEQDNAEAVLVNLLVSHMLVYNERSFDKVLSNAIIRYGFYEAMLKVVYPFLRKTGLLWTTSNVTPSQEHFASNLIKRKLFTAIDGIPYAERSKSKFILFLPPDEWHEIGLLLSEYLIRTAGGDTVYLGQNVPFESVETAIASVSPTHVLTFLTSPQDIDEKLNAVNAIGKRSLVKMLVYSVSDMKTTLRHIIFLDSPAALLKLI